VLPQAEWHLYRNKNAYYQVLRKVKNWSLINTEIESPLEGHPLPMPAYHVWSMSINVFVSYPVHIQNDSQNKRSCNTASFGSVTTSSMHDASLRCSNIHQVAPPVLRGFLNTLMLTLAPFANLFSQLRNVCGSHFSVIQLTNIPTHETKHNTLQAIAVVRWMTPGFFSSKKIFAYN